MRKVGKEVQGAILLSKLGLHASIIGLGILIYVYSM